MQSQAFLLPLLVLGSIGCYARVTAPASPGTPSESGKPDIVIGAPFAQCVAGPVLQDVLAEQLARAPGPTVQLTVSYPRVSPEYALDLYGADYEVSVTSDLRSAIETGEGLFAGGLFGTTGPAIVLGRNHDGEAFVLVRSDEAFERCDGFVETEVVPDAPFAECVAGPVLRDFLATQLAGAPGPTATLTVSYPRVSPEYALDFYAADYEVALTPELSAAVETGDGLFDEGLFGMTGPAIVLGRHDESEPFVLVQAGEALARCEGLVVTDETGSL